MDNTSFTSGIFFCFSASSGQTRKNEDKVNDFISYEGSLESGSKPFSGALKTGKKGDERGGEGKGGGSNRHRASLGPTLGLPPPPPPDIRTDASTGSPPPPNPTERSLTNNISKLLSHL